MTKVIGVRFKANGKSYYFSPGDLELQQGDYVIVETARGTECGEVAKGPHDVPDSSIVKPLKTVTRMADAVDVRRMQQNRADEKRAFSVCEERIAKHKLDMKLVDVEYTLDRNKILFYFTADGRIDFRDLVKDLAGVFRTRIELRQIGVRDEAKMLGGPDEALLRGRRVGAGRARPALPARDAPGAACGLRPRQMHRKNRRVP